MHSWDISFPTKFSEKNTTVPRTTPRLLSEPQNHIKSFILFVCLLIFWHFPFLLIIKLVYHLTINSFLLYFSNFLMTEVNILKYNKTTMSIFISAANAPCDSFLSIIWKTPSGSKGREGLGWKYDGNWITSNSLSTMASMANLEVETVVTEAAVTGTCRMLQGPDKRDFLVSVVQMQF